MKMNGITREALRSTEEAMMPLTEKETLPFDKDIANKSMVCTEEAKKTRNNDDELNQRRLTIIDMMRSKTTRKLMFIISAVW